MSADAARLLTERLFMTAAGTETYLVFQQRFPLREFCAFEIFDHADALAELEARYLFPLMTAVDACGHGLLLDALVWRAHPDYIAALGYRPDDLTRLNERAVALTAEAIAKWRARESRAASEFPVLITADIGPRGDGYKLGTAPSVAAAYDYHRHQLGALTSADVDVVCALTMTSANESIGIVKAAAELDVPIIVSPTVEVDGRLPDRSTLDDFIHRVDDASNGQPVFYMVNCAHPSHLRPTLDDAAVRGADWLARLKGFRANSSRRSHAELDNSTELDRGDPRTLAVEIAALREAHDLRLVGGCCGTDVEHIAAIARAVQ